MSNWHITADLESVFPTLDDAAERRGECINENWMSRLTLVSAAGRQFYVKTYASRGRWLRRLIGRSRIRAEWENLQTFAQLSIPSARLIGYGEQGVAGHYRGVLITEAVRETRDLAALVNEGHEILDHSGWRQTVIRRLSDAVRKMHSAGFVHNDLKWRNILVELTPEPAVYLIDCPQGRYTIGPFLARGKIKDFACLDKIAQQQLSRSERLRFYLAASGRKRLDAAAKREVRKILGFFLGRDKDR